MMSGYQALGSPISHYFPCTSFFSARAPSITVCPWSVNSRRVYLSYLLPLAMLCASAAHDRPVLIADLSNIHHCALRDSSKDWKIGSCDGRYSDPLMNDNSCGRSEGNRMVPTSA